MLLLSKLSQHFIELSLIKSCWSCKYKLLIGRLEGIAQWDQFWHLIIWHCRERDNTWALADKYVETNCQPGDLIKLEEIEINSVSAWRLDRDIEGWPGTREMARGIFPPSYYEEFESHSPHSPGWNMILVVVPVIPYICLCSQSGRNWKNKSKNFEYLDPVYELIDAKKIFLATTSPSVRTETEIGIRWMWLVYTILYRLCIRCITWYIIPQLNYREATSAPADVVWPDESWEIKQWIPELITQLEAPSADWWPVMLNLLIRPRLGSPDWTDYWDNGSSLTPLPRQPHSWWGWPLTSWCSSSPAARWWISSILEADMPVKGHYKVGPHKKPGLVGSNKRWADSEMVLS